MEKQRKKRYWHCWLLILLCLCMAGTWTVHAESEKETRTIRVAFPIQDEMSFFHKDGTPDGYNYVYLQKIAEYTGWEMEYIPYDSGDQNTDIQNALDDLKNGKVDLLGPLLKNKYTDDEIIFPSQSYGTVYTTLCALETSELRENNAASVSHLRVGLWRQAETRNEEVKTYLDTENFDYEIFYYDTAEEQYQALVNEEVDVISNLSLNPISGIRSIEKFAPRPYYFGSSKKNADIIQELDDTIQILKEVQPSLQDVLFERYFWNTRYNFALTNDQKEYLGSIKELQVLCVDYDAPYVYRRDGKPAGMLVSILDSFSKETDVAVNYTFCENQNEAEQKLKEKKYDIFIGANLTSGYCTKIGYVRSKSIMACNLAYLYKSDNNRHGTVAVESGLEEIVDTTDFDKVIICDNVLSCIDAVNGGKADYGITDRSGLEYYMYDTYSTLVSSLISGTTQTLCIGIARDSDLRLIRILNDYIYSLSDVKKTTFLERGNLHEYTTNFQNFVHQHPGQTALIGSSIAALLAIAFSMMFHAKKMKKKNEELQCANQVKSDFLTRMSHDIRTPMNGIIGLLNISDQFADDPEMVKAYHQKIRTASEYLLSLINDVLDMSKLDSNELILTEESVSLRELIKNCADILETKAAENGITLKLMGRDEFDPPRVFTSRLHLRQIILNVVSNAIKYNRPGGVVTATAVVLEETEDTVTCRFTVEDNGIGISEEFQKHMFEPFSQEHGEARSELKGTGLGLSIVKNIVDKMGGEIYVKSRENVGTRFEWILTFRIDKEYQPEDEDTEAISGNVSLKGMNILAAEDNELNAEILLFMLNDLGAAVTMAKNGEEAVDIFKQSETGYYNCILMDIMMPVMNGYEACRVIRNMNRPDAKTVPVIALTANAFTEDMIRSAEAGMNAHITKPLDMKKLTETIFRECEK